MNPLTVEVLFLEVGRLLSIAAISVLPALPASVPLNTAKKPLPLPSGQACPEH